jgi:hypothetical protein
MNTKQLNPPSVDEIVRKTFHSDKGFAAEIMINGKWERVTFDTHGHPIRASVDIKIIPNLRDLRVL